jgi:hypothetical protein
LIRGQLNSYFQNLDHRADDWVILSNIVDSGGAVISNTNDKIVIYVANITHETTISTYSPTKKTSAEGYVVVSPPIYINLYILFYANFSGANYSYGLGKISQTISYFQQNPFFNRDTLPNLPPNVDKLTLDLVNLDLHELNYLMGMAGVKYLPCIYYKLRMLPFSGDAIRGTVSAVSGANLPTVPEDPAGIAGNAVDE